MSNEAQGSSEPGQPASQISPKGSNPLESPSPRSSKPTSIKDISRRLREEAPKEAPAQREESATHGARGLVKEPTPEESETLSNTRESNPGDLTPEEKRKIKVRTKIDGIEEDAELTEEEIQRDYQKWKAAEKRFQAANETDKRAKDTLSKLDSLDGIAEILAQKGYDVQALAEAFLYDRLQLEAMTPEQRQIRELQEEKRIRDQRDQNLKQTQEQAQKAERTDKMRNELQTEIMTELKAGGLPPTPDVVWRIGQKMRANIEYNMQHPQGRIELSTKEAAALVRQDLMNEKKHYAKNMTPEQLIEMLGPEAADMIRRHDLSQIKNPIPQSRPKSEPQRTPAQKARRFVTDSEFKEHMKRMRAGR